MSLAMPSLSDPSLLKNQAYINGRWVNSRSGESFEVSDPASGKVISTMPDMQREDVQDAIDAAATALVAFRKTTGRQRATWLRAWYQLMMENVDDLARLITWENGKTLQEARSEVVYAADYLQWFSEEAPRSYGETIPASVTNHRIFTIKEPVGVCGLITPWNWPAGMVTRKIGPALAAGCTVVLKSPGETPLTAAALAELAHRAGVPPGVVNVVTSLEHTADVGIALTTSDTVKKVSFTGSTRVGKILMKQSADTLKKMSFELGGNAPFIIFDDANLDLAIEGAVACKFRSTGQTCVCANRIYVQRAIYSAFTEAFAERVRKFKVGPGHIEGVTHGPLIHERAIHKTEEHIANAVEGGAKIVVGGHKLAALGSNFFAPTVLSDMKNDMQVAHDETFGPVAGIFPFDSEDEIVKLANDTEVGLAGYLYSKDIGRCYRVAEAIEVGMIGINTGLISDVAMPFGGIKQSGFGREGSKYGMEEYQTVKSVTIGGGFDSLP